VLSMSAMENVTMSDWKSVSRFATISRRRLKTQAIRASQRFGFRAARISETTRNLSGGNQQKLMLARWQHSRPNVLLADEPTRGIDIGAKAEILTALEEMASEGLGIVVVSSELEEVAALSDCVVVLAEGRVKGQLVRGRDAISVTNILNTAYEVEASDDRA
jgi:ABC-type sugar transport system ATPase subunit